MNMYRRISMPDYLIYGLLALGIIRSLVANPGPLLLPVIIFGIIFLLYKFPPDRFRKPGRTYVVKNKSSARKRQGDRDRRKSNFRVIYGNKPDSDDEPPRYH